MSERELCIHIARTYLRECRWRRMHPGTAGFWSFLNSAACHRRRAMEMTREPKQGGLFA